MERTIKEIVRGVIAEWGGVSDKVSEMTDSVFNLILTQHRGWARGYTTLDIGGKEVSVGYKAFRLDIPRESDITSYCSEISVTLYFYRSDDPTNRDEIKEALIDNNDFINNYGLETKSIRLTLMWPFDDNFNQDQRGKEKCFGTIAHELKHAFQLSNARVGERDMSMERESRKLRNKEFGYDHKADKAIKKLIDSYVADFPYVFDRTEIDAEIQGMYNSCVNSGIDITDSKAYLNFKSTIEDYKDVREWYMGSQGEDVQRYVAYSVGKLCQPKDFFRIYDRRVRYLERKLRMVAAKFIESRGRQTGSFKAYANNEIAPEHNFVDNNNSRLNKMFDKFRQWRRDRQ